ncbi:MAG: efflux transporter outer membrane subunit [Caulobacteraceae bacterium]|nr:efflux transporter outer membrane subunit [Caulobacteraceae bacterium]
MRNTLHRLMILAPATALLSACAVGPNFKTPDAKAPAAWSPAASQARDGVTSQVVTGPADPAAWWASFNDPELTALVTRAAAQNLDVREALMRIGEARAQRAIAASAQWPQVSINGSDQVNRLSQHTPTGGLLSSIGKIPAFEGVKVANPYDQYQLGFDASWEVDLFGRVRRQVEAAKADQRASEEDSRAVQVSVMAEVGRAYVDLRATQAKRAVALENLRIAHDLLTLAGQRRGAGLTTEIDVARARAQASSVEAEIPQLDQQIALDVNQLSKLLAMDPGALAGELDAAQPVPLSPAQVPVGLPGDLVRRRPDIRAAEDRLHAATARQGVAIAALFPKVSLGAQGGFQSVSTSTLTDWASRFLVAGPTVQMPIFDAGQRRANIQLAGLHTQEAALDYRRTVLGALHEADNAITAYATDQSRRALLAETVAHDRDALDLAQRRQISGVASDLDVLDAERTLDQNALTLADANGAVAGDLVVIYKALGGGWAR